MTEADCEILRDAFERTLSEISAASVRVDELHDVIAEAYASGNDRPAFKAARELLPEGFDWPLYDERQREIGIGRSGNLHFAKTEQFVRRVIMLAMLESRRRRDIENSDIRPFWQFTAIVDPSTPRECVQRNKVTKQFNDPFWIDAIPCWRPDCRCRVRPLSERDMARRGAGA